VTPPTHALLDLNLWLSLPSMKKLQTVDFPTPAVPTTNIDFGSYYLTSSSSGAFLFISLKLYYLLL